MVESLAKKLLNGTFYDISMPIHPEMPVYKNKPEKKPVIEIHTDPIKNVRETWVKMNVHTGTHLDAPLHLLPGGADISKFNLNNALNSCRVLDFTGVESKITAEHLQDLKIKQNDYLLFKTKNSDQDKFNYEFIYLSKQGAAYLADLGIKGVGIDALGIERDQPQHETHRILFEHNITILEGLRLRQVKAGHYLLLTLPLYLPGIEASPVRAVLIDQT